MSRTRATNRAPPCNNLEAIPCFSPKSLGEF